MLTPSQVVREDPVEFGDYENQLAEFRLRRKAARARLRYLGSAIERVAESAGARAGVPDREFSDDASAVLHLKGAIKASEDR